MAFIGEDHLFVAEDSDMEDITPKLVLLDMSSVGESLTTPREVRFACDPRCSGAEVGVMVEGAGHSDFSKVIGQDVPFYPDPSRRVLVLTFSPRGGAYDAVLGIRVVRSETILRLARENGGGVIGWNAWGKYTVAPDVNDTPGANGFPRYSVSGSRFARIFINKTEKLARVKLYDLSHWSLQRLDVGPDECEGSEKKVGFRVIEGVLELSRGKVSYVAMLQDSLVFFSVGSY